MARYTKRFTYFLALQQEDIKDSKLARRLFNGLYRANSKFAVLGARLSAAIDAAYDWGEVSTSEEEAEDEEDAAVDNNVNSAKALAAARIMELANELANMVRLVTPEQQLNCFCCRRLRQSIHKPFICRHPRRRWRTSRSS